MRWKVISREARRLCIEAWPGFFFLLVGSGALLIPMGISRDTHHGMVLGSLVLQFFGLSIATYGLRRRGILFDRDAPWTATWKWIKSIKRIFQQPKGVEVEVEATVSLSGGSTAEVIISAGKRSLDERVEEIEKQIKELKEAVRKIRIEMSGKIQEVNKAFEVARNQQLKELRELKAQLDRSAVGSFPWEWVGLGWLLVGVLFHIIAELIEGV